MSDPDPNVNPDAGPDVPIGNPPPDPDIEPQEDRVHFQHKCTEPDCTNVVEFDDEPFCPEHSPETGQRLPGYSAIQHLRLERAVNERVDIPAEATDYVPSPPVVEVIQEEGVTDPTIPVEEMRQAQAMAEGDIVATNDAVEIPQPEEG